MFNRGQGTVEYLVIISVVVVIALIVVGLLITQVGNSSQVSIASSEIANKIGVNGLSLGSSVMGMDANGLLVLKNINVENLTLSKIVVDGVDHNFSVQLVAGEEKSFKLHGVVACDGERRNYSVKVEYFSASSLTKTADFGNISLDCTNVVTPAKVAVEEVASDVASDVISPSITLSSPGADGSISESSVDFNFSISDSDVSYCYLVLDEVAHPDKNIDYSMSPLVVYTIVYSGISLGSHTWDVNCVDSSNNKGTSGEFRVLTAMPTGLIAHYKSNDNASNTIVLDSSGNNKNAVLSANSNTLSVSGKINNALNISVGNHIDATAIIDTFGGTNSWSIAMWWRPSNGSNHSALFGFDNYAIYSYWNCDNYQIKFGTTGGEFGNYLDLGSGGTWYHLVFVKDGSTWKVYANGVVGDSNITSSAVLDVSGRTMYLGYVGGSQNQDASFDDFRIYDKALSQSEINEIYASGNGTEK